MNKIWSVIVWIFSVAVLTACNEPEQQKQAQYVQPPMQVQQQQQPVQQTQQPQVVYQQAPPAAPTASAGHDGTDMLLAAGVGYAIGRVGASGGSGGNSNGGGTTVVNRTVVNKTIVNQASPSASRPSGPTYRPSVAPTRSFSSSSSFSRGRR